MAGRFIRYELVSTDVESAKAFYANVVGWGARDVSTPGPAYCFFTAGDAAVAGLMSLPEDAQSAGATSHWIGYVGVDDLDAAVRRAGELGGSARVSPTDLPGVSRFAIVADPQMARLAVIEETRPAKGRSAELGAPGRVGWHELFAADWEKAFAFYSSLFGWKKADSHVGLMGAYQRFAAGAETIGGMFTKPPTLPFAFWLYYFNVGDIEAAARRVEACGGEVLYGPIEAPGGSWIIHCLDPQGAIFGLIERRSRKAIGYFVPPAPVDAGRRR
jgi:uncharacterized protein